MLKFLFNKVSGRPEGLTLNNICERLLLKVDILKKGYNVIYSKANVAIVIDITR